MNIRADRRVGLLLGGVILSTFLALGATVALPASDESLGAEDVELSEEAARGRDVYLRQALWQCNVAYARETSVDGTQAATTADQVAGVAPVMLGAERTGRDGDEVGEACGVKLPEKDASAVDAFLRTRVGP